MVTHPRCNVGGSTTYPAGRLLISATLEDIDGEYGVLGSAGPTSVWSSCTLTSVSGSMKFDTADVSRLETEGTLYDAVLHEMGHVIGIG